MKIIQFNRSRCFCEGKHKSDLQKKRRNPTQLKNALGFSAHEASKHQTAAAASSSIGFVRHMAPIKRINTRHTHTKTDYAL